MKFGKHLLEQQYPPWSTEYLPYKSMKKMLKRKDRGKLCAICGLSILLIILAYFAMS